MASKTIVILNGGVGGMTAANGLRAKLPLDYRIALIKRNAEYSFAQSFLWLITGASWHPAVKIHLGV